MSTSSPLVDEPVVPVMAGARPRLMVGLVLVGVPILLWSSQAVYMKFLLQATAGPFELSLYRSLGALLLGVMIVRGKVRLPRSFGAYLPGIFLALNFITYSYALQYIDAYLLMVIETSSIILGLVIDRWLNTKVHVSPLAVAMVGVGALMLCVDASRIGAPPWLAVGLVLAFLTAVSFALFNCTLKFLPRQSETLIPLMLPVLLCTLPFTVGQMHAMVVNWPGTLLMLLVVGVLQTGVVYFLWARAGRYFSGSLLCQLAILAIPATFLMEFLFLGFQLNWLQFNASILMTIAILLNVALASRVRRADEPWKQEA